MGFKSKTEQWEDTEFIRRGQIEAQKKQVVAILLFAKIVEEAVKDAGPNGIPSGHLYAAMMGRMNIDTYNYTIGLLKEAGAITEQNHLLRWTRK